MKNLPRGNRLPHLKAKSFDTNKTEVTKIRDCCICKSHHVVISRGDVGNSLQQTHSDFGESVCSSVSSVTVPHFYGIQTDEETSSSF